MTNFVALLRGINVSGQKVIKMELLRASFECLGFTHVRTYVQSGNVVFRAATNSTAFVTERIERQISRDFGFAVPVFLRTAEELRDIVEFNPLLKDPSIDHSRLHVTFLSGATPRTAADSLAGLAAAPERLYISSREIYLYCPNGYGRTKLSNTVIEKKLRLHATTRNWKTVNALLAVLP